MCMEQWQAYQDTVEEMIKWLQTTGILSIHSFSRNGVADRDSALKLLETICLKITVAFSISFVGEKYGQVIDEKKKSDHTETFKQLTTIEDEVKVRRCLKVIKLYQNGCMHKRSFFSSSKR